MNGMRMLPEDYKDKVETVGNCILTLKLVIVEMQNRGDENLYVNVEYAYTMMDWI